MIELVCEGCKFEFEKPHSEFVRNKRLERKNYCSRECAMKNASSFLPITSDRTCKECLRDFKASSRHSLCPSCRELRKMKKCLDCPKMVRRTSERCHECSGKNRTGEKSATWTGGRVNKKGYIMIYVPEHPRASNNGGYVFEHILVMENKLGRYLEQDENVHHLYGIKDDNNIENLELWIKPQPTGIRSEDAVVWAQRIINRYRPDLLKQ